MARVTIEDCLKTEVYDKFDLVLIASQRTKQLIAGSHSEVVKDVKPTLLSLIEIEERAVSVEKVREAVVESYQKYGENASRVQENNEEEDEEEVLVNERMDSDEDFSGMDEDFGDDLDDSDDFEEDDLDDSDLDK